MPHDTIADVVDSSCRNLPAVRLQYASGCAPTRRQRIADQLAGHHDLDARSASDRILWPSSDVGGAYLCRLARGRCGPVAHEMTDIPMDVSAVPDAENLLIAIQYLTGLGSILW